MIKTKAPKRPTRDEFELEELGNQLVEAKEEGSTLVLTVWGKDQVRGRIVELDARTRLVHISTPSGELEKIPFLDIMRADHAS